MKIEQLEFRDPETGRTIKPGAYLLTCDCGHLTILEGNFEVFPNTKALVEFYIRRYALRVGTFQRNCQGKRTAKAQLALWERIATIT